MHALKHTIARARGRALSLSLYLDFFDQEAGCQSAQHQDCVHAQGLVEYHIYAKKTKAFIKAKETKCKCERDLLVLVCMCLCVCV